jgi:hypothetical protein
VGSRSALKQDILFLFELTVSEGEGPTSRSRALARDGQGRAFTPALIFFIALPETKDKLDPG